MKQERDCDHCEGNAKLMEAHFPGHKEGMEFRIYHCNDCNTSFALPKEDATKIYNFIYSHGEVVPGYNRYLRYFNTIKQQDHPLEYLAQSEPAYWGLKESLNGIGHKYIDPRILEIGSGLGYLTYALKEENYNITGLEISREAVDNARDNFGEFYLCQDLFDYIITHEGSYDIIIMTEVIEHVHDPIAFLDTALKLLKKNGHIILTTPDRSLASTDIVWSTDPPPIHYWWFSEDSMKYFAKKYGLDLEFIDFYKYYRKNPNKYRSKNHYPMPIISANWELLKKKKSTKNWHLNGPKALIPLFKLIKNTFLKMKGLILIMKSRMDPDLILCSNKGEVLCAIFHKTRD